MQRDGFAGYPSSLAASLDASTSTVGVQNGPRGVAGGKPSGLLFLCPFYKVFFELEIAVLAPDTQLGRLRGERLVGAVIRTHASCHF